MLDVTKHDILQPVLDAHSILGLLSLRKRQLDVLPSEVDIANGCNEKGRSTAESLHQPPFLGSLHNFVHGIFPLHDLYLIRKLFPHNIQDTLPGDALENDSIAQWGSKKLESPLLRPPQDKEVRRPRLRDTAILAQQ